LKVLVICFLFILVRAALPRYRYDQLMDLGWKIFLPYSLSFLVFTVGVLLAFDSLPLNHDVWNFLYTENMFFLTI
jgi:NADH-quinone oxidoreductase subunit H